MKKPLYIKPKAEVFELPQSLSLLNSLSLSMTVTDWIDVIEAEEKENWGDFTPYP